MTKDEFKKRRTKCPWYYIGHGEPKCMAQNTAMHHRRHCSLKNCAVAYWTKEERHHEGDYLSNSRIATGNDC